MWPGMHGVCVCTSTSGFSVINLHGASGFIMYNGKIGDVGQFGHLSILL